MLVTGLYYSFTQSLHLSNYHQMSHPYGFERVKTMNIDKIIATLQINDLLCQFFQSFDDKDWSSMESCLTDQVFCDYSSFRNVPPDTISAEHYVEQRRSALSDIELQHNFLNLKVLTSSQQKARVRCNYIIHRFHPEIEQKRDAFFHSYGHYEFTLVVQQGQWKISGIVQYLLKNHGNPEIHGATRRC